MLGSKFEQNKLGRWLRMREMPEEKNLGEGDKERTIGK